MKDGYEVRRSRRKTLSLQVDTEGTVIVRAPVRCPNRIIESFVTQHREWIDRQRKKPPTAMTISLSAEEEMILRVAAKEYLPGKAAEYAARLGVVPAAVTITKARTRFGSCSGTNRLSFSLRLMMYPRAAVDYVALHEVCHILEKNHGPKFYALVASVMPDWKERRALLRQPWSGVPGAAGIFGGVSSDEI